MPRIHVTDRTTFKRCRRKYDYQVREKLELKDSTYGALWFGSGIHEALATYYTHRQQTGEFSKQALFVGWAGYLADKEKTVQLETPEQHEKFDNMLALADGMIESYYEYSVARDKDWQILAVEEEFQYKIPGTRCTLVATIDLLVKAGNRIWIVDHKTRTNFSPMEHLELDDQMTAYIFAVRNAGINVAGAIYNEIKKKVPSDPPVLKDGRLSQNKMIDTTRDIYYKKIIQLGQDPADYADMLQALGSKEFIHREVVTRSRASLETFGDNIVHEVREMMSKNTPCYPYPTPDCLWDCSYRMLCRTENDKGDVDLLRNTLYRIGKGRH
jgi:hypothetical protein